jgi:hypothetical protein
VLEGEPEMNQFINAHAQTNVRQSLAIARESKVISCPTSDVFEMLAPPCRNVKQTMALVIRFFVSCCSVLHPVLVKKIGSMTHSRIIYPDAQNRMG